MDQGQQGQGQERGRMDPDHLDPTGELRELLQQHEGMRAEMDTLNNRIVQHVREALGLGGAQRGGGETEQGQQPARQQPAPVPTLTQPHQPRQTRR